MSSSRLKIAITDWTFPDLKVEEEILRPLGCEFAARQCKSESEIIEHTADADCVIAQFGQLTPKVIDSFKHVRGIVRYGIGVDNINLEAAGARGIPVCNVPDYCIDEVADHTLSLILAITRQVPQVSNRVRAGKWKTALELDRMRALSELSTGVIGFGRIGREVVHRLKSFKGPVLVYDPIAPAEDISRAGAEPVSLGQLFSRSDIITLHCPSTAQTRYMINAEAFSQMKRGVILINVARGNIVRQDDLVDALQSGKVAAAGLDVTDPEPIPEDSPLLGMEQVVITNHIASCSPRAVTALRRRVAETAAMVIRGEKLPNIVNQQFLSNSSR